MTPGRIPFHPDRRTLVEFAAAGFVVLTLVSAPLALFRHDPRLAAILAAVGAILGLLGLIHPRLLRIPFVVASLVAWPIGLVVSQVALALLYFGMFTPIALLFRLLGRDALHRRLDPSAPSYWDAYDPDQGAERYFHTY